MSLMQTLQQITALQQEVQQQLRVIDSFTRTNKDNMSLVRNELKGSNKGYDSLMVQSLDKAEASLKKAAAALQTSSDALQRVRSV